MRKILLLVLLAPLAALFPACLADATSETVGEIAEPGIHYGAGKPGSGRPLDPVSAARAWLAQHPGQCGDACYDIGINICAAADGCAGADPSEQIECVGRALSCDAAEHAASGEPWGLSYCWRECEGVR